MKINWSFFTKQRSIVMVSLVMCLVILGSANYIYTKNQSASPDLPTYGDSGTPDEAPGNDVTVDSTTPDNSQSSTSSNYFDAYRENRQSVRDMEMRYVQTLSNSENSDEAVKKQAEERLLEIATLMEKELKIESLIRAKGFEDAVAFVEDGSINIVVKAKELSSAQATKILKLVADETGEAAQNITIITRI